MPHHPVKLADGRYVLWSTVVDAPISEVMDAERLKQWVDSDYWFFNKDYVDKEDGSTPDKTGYTWDDEGGFWVENSVLDCNRAGPDESSITAAQILEQYTYEP